MQRNAFAIALQDVSAGIRVFSRVVGIALGEGDSLIVTGTIKHYRGDVELVETRVTVVPSTPRVIPPRNVPIDVAHISRYPGQLVRVRGRVDGFAYSEGGQGLRVRDTALARGTITIWVPANHGAPIDLSKARPNGSLTVAGIVTSFKDNVDDSLVWQLVPRTKEDVVVSATSSTWASPARTRCWGDRSANSPLRTPVTRSVASRPSRQGDVRRGSGPATQVDRGSSGRRDQFQSLRLSRSTRGGRTRARHQQPTAPRAANCATSSQLRHERDLHALALVDELTGVHNRRGFTLFADQEIARARRNGRMPTLVFADLDDLKGINPAYGHASGDAAIRLVATAFKSILRETDIVARWSDDEFVALLSDGDPNTAEQSPTGSPSRPRDMD